MELAKKFRIAGIGSRVITEEKEALLSRIGTYVASCNWLLSSGNALGSDEYFAKGINSINPKNLVLYLPWDSYNSELIVRGNWVTSEIKPDWEEKAKLFHARWDLLKQGGRKMMARNIGIVYKANVVLAVLNHSKSGFGGTGQGWRYAESLKLPKMDLAGKVSFEEAKDFLDYHYETQSR